MEEMKNNNADKTVAILLATYNGGRYLAEQLDSLFGQTVTAWTLYVHDDGSKDETVQILHDYAARHDNLVILDYPSQHGAKNNFLSLVRQVEADYYFFCDQDDRWVEDKVERQLRQMQQLEQTYSTDKPLLVFSDTYVADANLNVIHPSLWRLSGAHPEFLTTFDEAAATPFVTGCTMLFNRAGRAAIQWPATEATMHDAWITLCILKAQGVVFPIPSPLLFYRQHGSNTLGASDLSKHGLTYKLRHLKTVLRKDVALLRMLHALGYGSFFKFLKYKHIYKSRCRKAKQTAQQP